MDYDFIKWFKYIWNIAKKECEIEEKVRGELREELRDEVREEARTNVMNAIETLENQGKRPDEIITTLKTMFWKNSIKKVVNYG